jgi:phage gp29-like protein
MVTTSKPQVVVYEELPVYGVPPPDRTWILEQTLQELERGLFVNAARLWDSMLRDDRIFATVQTRVNGLLGMPIDLEAGKDTAQGRAVSDEVKDCWSDMFPSSELAELQRWGLGVGVGVAEKEYKPGANKWEFCIKKVWHPQTLIWRWDERRYYLTTQNKAQIPLPHPWEDSSQWIIYTPYGYERAWLRGLIRPLAKTWMIRQWSDRDFARWCEVHAIAIRKAIVPQKGDDKEKKSFFQQVSRLGNETTIRVPQDSDGNKFDVELLEAVADTYQGLESRIKLCDDNIAIVALGQKTSTEGASGLGSDEAPGDSVRIDLKKFDNTAMSQCLYKQGLKQWARFNHGRDELAPKPPMHEKRSGFWIVEPVEDKAKAADQMLKTAQALVAFKAATSPVDDRQLLEQGGVPILTEEQHAQKQQKAIEYARQMAQTKPDGDEEDDSTEEDDKEDDE